MKTLPAQISALVGGRSARRDLRVLAWFALALALMVAGFTVLFYAIMAWEGQEHSWLSGLYWTLVTMSTLGFGDITFRSDVGRIFPWWS